uniref:(northern house mosquito) hypothetical protein n=1 Tax=Culex pipiens TaxID=7175 RepID=A0A8D8F3U3_CULPI
MIVITCSSSQYHHGSLLCHRTLPYELSFAASLKLVDVACHLCILWKLVVIFKSFVKQRVLRACLFEVLNSKVISSSSVMVMDIPSTYHGFRQVLRRHSLFHTINKHMSIVLDSLLHRHPMQTFEHTPPHYFTL